MRIIKYIVIGFAVLFVIGAIAEGSKNKSTQPTTTAPAVTHTAAPDGASGVTAEEAFNMDASCETVHADEHAKCEHLYASKKLEEEGAEATAVLKHRQAEQTASNLEAIAQTQTEAEGGSE